MKSRNTLCTIACLLLLMSISTLAGNLAKVTDTSETKTSAEVNWMRYDDGLVKAKADDKHVMIDFSTSWCVYCKKMDREIFSQPDVIELLNEHFVSIKVNGDSKQQLDIEGYKISEKDLTKKEYHVRGYPAFWFLKSDGTKLAQIKGYRPKNYMMEALTYIAEKKYDTTNIDGKSSGN